MFLIVLINVGIQFTAQSTAVKIDPATVQTATNSNGMYLLSPSIRTYLRIISQVIAGGEAK